MQHAVRLHLLLPRGSICDAALTSCRVLPDAWPSRKSLMIVASFEPVMIVLIVYTIPFSSWLSACTVEPCCSCAWAYVVPNRACVRWTGAVVVASALLASSLRRIVHCCVRACLGLSSDLVSIPCEASSLRRRAALPPLPFIGRLIKVAANMKEEENGLSLRFIYCTALRPPFAR